MGGIYIYVDVLAAIKGRAKTGHGTWIEITMLESK